MNEPIAGIPHLGIDVSKDSLDLSLVAGGRPRHHKVANNAEGWRALSDWVRKNKVPRVHALLEATGYYSLGVALALHDAGHVVSVINPAQIRDFGRSKLGRNKTDKIDCGLIREFGEKFSPAPWSPPSAALRRLGELQTMRNGFVASRVEWLNRVKSGMTDPVALAFAKTTVTHLQAQIDAIDKAIADTINGDDGLRARRELLLTIDGVGPVLAAILLAELPDAQQVATSAQAVAYAGLNPRRRQSGTANPPTPISRIGNAALRTALFMPAMAAMRCNKAVIALVERLRAAGRLAGKQIVVAAMRKLLAICFGVLKTGKPFDASLAMPKQAA
jgi:transposase